MNTSAENEYTKRFEQELNADLTGYLQSIGEVDSHLPQCPDVEEKWTEIAYDYLPDGIREFNSYPVSSLGWMMFIGMAMAHFWDSDWNTYGKAKNIYMALRDIRGYDSMDDAILEDVLALKETDAQRFSAIAGECASRTHSMLMRQKLEPGTESAMKCYVAALHCLYLAGMRTELNYLGYRMTKL